VRPAIRLSGLSLPGLSLPRWATLVLLALALALAGCETTAEKSARLERAAKRATVVQSGLLITHPSTDVKVLETVALHGSEGAAAVVVLRNLSSRPERHVPIAITVKSASGQTLFQNNAPGLEPALVSVASLPAHGELAWVDDQLPATGKPTAVSAVLGQAPAPAGSPPQIEVQGAHPIEDPSRGVGTSAKVSNRSRVAQQSLVVFAVARRGGRIVAAGRALVPELAAGSATQFQVFFVGDPRGARVQFSAPATTFH
jgi:hypothetical protein